MVSFYRKEKSSSQPEITVRCTALDLEGRGVARDAQGTIFVPGIMPGEEARVQVTRAHHGIREARLQKLITLSPDRQPGLCPQGQCGGCPLRHLPAAMAFAAKVEGVMRLLRKGLGDFIPAAPDFTVNSPELHYRRSARLSVRRRGPHVECGFHQARSAELCPLSACPALVPELEALLPELQELVGQQSLRHLLGHIDLLAGNGRVGLHLRLSASPEAAAVAELAHWAAARDLICTISEANPAGEDGERFLNGRMGDLRVDCGGCLIAVRPSAFVQINAAVNAALVNEVLAAVNPRSGQKVLDLYSGIGNFSFPLARAGSQVLGAEVVAAMVGDANRQAEELALPARFVEADLADPHTLARLDSAVEAAVLDPGREGAPAVVRWLASGRIPRIVLISCNPQAAVRDLAVLKAAGFVCTRLGIADMFPQTTHVETFLLLERRP